MLSPGPARLAVGVVVGASGVIVRTRCTLLCLGLGVETSRAATASVQESLS
jgi:hypothetical protein